MAFAIYGMAVVWAPIIGPTLGCYIVDQLQLALDFLHQRAGRNYLRCSCLTGWLRIPLRQGAKEKSTRANEY